MANIIQKLFGSEEKANELQQLDAELKAAIEDFKKLENDWKEKVRQVKEFVKDWDEKWDLSSLKKNIKIVKELDLDEIDSCKKAGISMLKISDLVGTLYKKTGDSRFLIDMHQFNSEEEHFRSQLERILTNQMVFIKVHLNADIGEIRFFLPELIHSLNEEGELLNLDNEIISELQNMSLSLNKVRGQSSQNQILMERLKKLKEFGYPISNLDFYMHDDASNLAYYLVFRWNETEQIVKSDKKYYSIAFKVLPSFRYVVFKYGIVATGLNLIRIIKVAEDPKRKGDSLNYFTSALESIPNLVLRYGFDYIIKLVGISKPEEIIFLLGELHRINNVLDKIGHEYFVDLAIKYKPKSIRALINSIAIFSDLLDKNNISLYVAGIAEIFNYAAGTEDLVSKSFRGIRYLIVDFKEDIFKSFLVPIAKAQAVGTHLCYDSFVRIRYGKEGTIRPPSMFGIQNIEDLELLKNICERYPIKAYDILVNIIEEGLEYGIVARPIGKDSEVILSFLKNAPAYILDIFARYKELYYSNRLDKNIQMVMLFENIGKIKEEIYEGNASFAKIDEKLFFGVLYHIFAPELTIERNQYKQVFNSRNDRQSDYPDALQKISGMKVKISKGSVKLKEGKTLDTAAWQTIIDVVQEVNNSSPQQINPAQLGFELMENLVNNLLKEKRKHYLALIYGYSVLKGQSLPVFSQTFEILMKYKEFIGDRMNDLLFSILSESLKQDQNRYKELNSVIIGRTLDMKGLCKALEDIWNPREKKKRGISLEEKERIILKILERNGYYLESINDWQPHWTRNEIENWIRNINANIIDKGLITRIKNGLYGEDYTQMQNEMGKFKFERGKKFLGAKKTFTFNLSKKKAHSVAMFNMGVCIAVDEKLWNKPDFWQMIIFDEEKNACGGVLYRTIEEKEKKYLICSIRPSQKILSVTSPTSVYDKIMQYSKLIKKILKFDAVLIPEKSEIHSNRGSIQTEIQNRNYRTITLKREYTFSYDPYNYTYKKFFVV